MRAAVFGPVEGAAVYRIAQELREKPHALVGAGGGGKPADDAPSSAPSSLH